MMTPSLFDELAAHEQPARVGRIRVAHRGPIRGSYSADRQCDARCTGAYGPNCECQCAGRNHGADHQPRPGPLTRSVDVSPR